MTNAPEPENLFINEPTVRAMHEAGAIKEFIFEALAQGGYKLVVHFGMTYKTMNNQKGQVRIFRNLDNAARYIRRDIKAPRLTIDMTNAPPYPKPRHRANIRSI